MAQKSIQFAAAKIKMKQANSVSQNDIARLSEAVTYNEALQVLVDIGFLSSENRDYDFAVDRYVSNACNLVNKFTTDQNLSNAMLLKFDGHNLKVLLKSRLLNIEPDYLYNCGTIPVDKLKHAVANHNYKPLPNKLKVSMQNLEKEIVTNFDPLKIDVEIDKAVYSVIFDYVNNLNNNTIKDYFTKQVTFLNILMMLRTLQMGKKPEFLADMLIDGGLISKADMLKAFTNPNKLTPKLTLIDKTFANMYDKLMAGQANLSALEKTSDDVLLSIFKPFYYKPINIENLAAYILTTQRQGAAIRLIMAAKASGASQDDINERMRAISVK